MAKYNNLEAKVQSSFFEWLALAMPEIRESTFAIPNGGSRNPIEAINLKHQGVTRGVFDIFVAIPNKQYHGLFIEFKVGMNKLTKHQKSFQNTVTNSGYMAVVCYNFDEAKEIIHKYLEQR